MKNASQAIAAGALLGALFLGGCAADPSGAAPAASATATPSPAASAQASPEGSKPTLPDPVGLEDTPVIVDPSMDALSGVEDSVRAALANFLKESRSFEELQVGSRPVAATDGDILAPVMQPLMSEKAWADSVDQFQSAYIPTWYPGGNPVALFAIQDPSEAKHLVPDDNGYTFVHADKNPMTISVAQTGYPGTYIAVTGMTYRAYFTNTLGEAVAVQMEMDYVFTPDASGGWDMWQWNGIPQYFVAETQEQLDAMPEI